MLKKRGADFSFLSFHFFFLSFLFFFLSFFLLFFSKMKEGLHCFFGSIGAGAPLDPVMDAPLRQALHGHRRPSLAGVLRAMGGADACGCGLGSRRVFFFLPWEFRKAATRAKALLRPRNSNRLDLAVRFPARGKIAICELQAWVAMPPGSRPSSKDRLTLT